MIQLTLTLKMTTAQVLETVATVNNNSPIQDYIHPDDQTQPTFIARITTLYQVKKGTIKDKRFHASFVPKNNLGQVGSPHFLI